MGSQTRLTCHEPASRTAPQAEPTSARPGLRRSLALSNLNAMSYGDAQRALSPRGAGRTATAKTAGHPAAASQPVATLRAALLPRWMLSAKPGSSADVSATVTLGTTAQVSVTVTGKLTRDDDRKYRLTGSIRIAAGLGIDLALWKGSLMLGRTYSRTWSFRDFAAFSRWTSLQVADIQHMLAQYKVSAGQALTPPEKVALRSKVSADQNVEQTAKTGDVTANANMKGLTTLGGTASYSSKAMTFHRKNRHGVAQTKRGRERRVDISLVSGPVTMTGFYQDMSGHANGDMDGEYLNLSFSLNARAKNGPAPKDVPLTAAEQLRRACAVLKDRPQGAASKVLALLKGHPDWLASFGGGVEIEWVKDTQGLRLRFIRAFKELRVGVGGDRAGASATQRHVLREWIGTHTLNYVTQLHNGFARRGKKGLADWQLWVRRNRSSVLALMHQVGTKGSAAYRDAPSWMRQKYTIPAGPHSPETFAADIARLCTSMRRGYQKSWAAAHPIQATVTRMGPTPTFDPRMTTAGSAGGTPSFQAFLAQGGAVDYAFAELGGHKVRDTGAKDLRRMFRQFGYRRETRFQFFQVMDRTSAPKLASSNYHWAAGQLRSLSPHAPGEQQRFDGAESELLSWFGALIRHLRQQSLAHTQLHTRTP